MMTPMPIHPDAQPDLRDTAERSGTILALRRELARVMTDNELLRVGLDKATQKLAQVLGERDALRNELREIGRTTVMVERTVPPCTACGGAHPTYACPDVRAALFEVAP